MTPSFFLITPGRNGTLMMSTRYGIMMTNAVTRSSYLSKLLVTPPLDVDQSTPHSDHWIRKHYSL